MKRINVRVVVNAQKARVLEDRDGYKVYVNAPAEGGRANDAVISLLADFFGVRRNLVTIVSGERSRKKIVAIDARL